MGYGWLNIFRSERLESDPAGVRVVQKSLPTNRCERREGEREGLVTDVDREYFNRRG